MSVIKVPSFGGMIPAMDERLLPDTNSADAYDTWVYDGAVKGVVAPVLVRNLTNSQATRVYRIPLNTGDPTNIGAATWLEFSNVDTDVLRAPVIGDSFDRYYWVAPNVQARYLPKASITSGSLMDSTGYLLGIPTPTSAAPTVTATGGVSAVTTTRVYAYTYVSAYGEEGAPSATTSVSGKVDATWNVALPVAPSTDTTGRNITTRNVYRTVTSSLGVATYYLIASAQPLTVTSFNDTVSDTIASSNSELVSATWTPPPTDLQGWVSMPNGIVAGWRNNEVWFSEPYRPHAWPAGYTLAVEYPVVGLGVIGQSLICCTTGFPTAITGVNPSSMTQAKIATFEPCLSRGSIISSPEGVYYASQNGLVLVSAGQVENITREVINRDQWLTLTTIPTARTARLGTALYIFGTQRLGGFEPTAFESTAVSLDDVSGARKGVLMDPMQPRVGVHHLTMDTNVVSVYTDPWSGSVLMVRNNKVYSLDLSAVTPVRQKWKWKSKVFELPKPDNLGALQVVFEESATFNQSAVANDSLVQTLGSDQYGLVRVYANGTLIATREIRQSNAMLRLPSGFKATYWQIEVEAQVKVYNVSLASTVKEIGRA